MKYEESYLQQRCVTFLTYRYSHLYWNHSPNEGQRSERMGAILKKMGMQKGYPDLEILHDNTSLFIEFKAKTGRQSPDQKRVQGILEKMGYTYLICRDYDEFVEICHKHLGEEDDPDLRRLREILGQP